MRRWWGGAFKSETRRKQQREMQGRAGGKDREQRPRVRASRRGQTTAKGQSRKSLRTDHCIQNTGVGDDSAGVCEGREDAQEKLGGRAGMRAADSWHFCKEEQGKGQV